MILVSVKWPAVTTPENGATSPGKPCWWLNLQMTTERDQLPIVEYKEQLLDMIDKHAVIIVRGQTGSGKTTQVLSSSPHSFAFVQN